MMVAPSNQVHKKQGQMALLFFFFEKGNSEAIDFFFEKRFLKGESFRNSLKILSWHITGIAP